MRSLVFHYITSVHNLFLLRYVCRFRPRFARRLRDARGKEVVTNPRAQRDDDENPDVIRHHTQHHGVTNGEVEDVDNGFPNLRQNSRNLSVGNNSEIKEKNTYRSFDTYIYI